MPAEFPYCRSVLPVIVAAMLPLPSTTT